ncbi:alpha/beta hydrolase [Catenuloplanes sp. NPDC051500]|uniref:alpha/beta hydrolase n=1 Tax=Catenuloplanes sp. NPDC051500 TaxID=3363959 RepID=UPI0037A9E42C
MVHPLEALALRRLLALPPPVQRLIGRYPALDPTVAMLLRVQRWRGLHGLTAGTPDRTRRRTRDSVALTAGAPTQVFDVRPVRIAGRLPGRHYVPAAASAPMLVFFHGGGFVAGDLDTHDEICRLLCAHAGVHVLAADYALAPENPFPAAVQDARSAVVWAFSHAASLGADPARIAVGGDSAGANLAAVVCQLLRGSGAPVLQLLVYPLLDHFGPWPSRSLFADGPVLTARDLAFFRANYLAGFTGSEADFRHSPLRAPDLRGLPPAVVVTAGLDPLRDEGEAYAERLRAAGVPVRAWRVAGMVHAFMNLAGVSGAAHTAAVEIAKSVREMMPAR